MAASLHVPSIQKPRNQWYPTLLWGIATLIGALVLSTFAQPFIFRTIQTIDEALYPGGSFGHMMTMHLRGIDHDLRSIVSAIVQFGLIGLVLGCLQLPAAKN